MGALASIGFVGTLGQAAILHNSLVHSYPFKMMGMPPASFYSSIGEAGYYIAVIVSLVAIAVSVWLPRSLTSVLPVVICPSVYWLVFEASHFTQGFTKDQLLEVNFDGYTGYTARYEFAYEALVLLFVGSIIGVTIGLALTKLEKVVANRIA